MLQESVATLKGVGASRAAAFGRLSIRTLGDLLYFMPREYQDFSAVRETVFAYARRACRAEADHRTGAEASSPVTRAAACRGDCAGRNRQAAACMV